ncbi:MAG: hypothetical protein H6834_09710 [Planctomycetes bacterium]|nr:hypothetical protein [Planctomycetota bacterium]
MQPQILKQSPLRRIELVDDECGARVRKVHLGRRKARARAHREASALRRLERAGIPAPRVLDTFATVDGACVELTFLPVDASLDEALPALSKQTDRERLFASALALVEHALRAGTFDADLHAGNVWLGPDERLWLADLHRTRRWPRLLWPWLAWRTRVRFLRFFLAHLEPERLVRALERHVGLRAAHRALHAARRSRRGLLIGKDRRARGAHRSYVVERDGEWLRVRERTVDECGLRVLHGFEGGDTEGSSCLKRARRSAVFRAQEGTWVVKSFDGRGARRRARSAFRAALAFHHSHLETVEAPAVSTTNRRGLLLMPFVAGPTLARAIHERHLTPRERRHLARALGRDLARMHADGLRLRDLRGENLLIARRGSSFHLRWIDLVGTRRRLREPGDSRVARDLARLLATFPADSTLEPRAIAAGFAAYVRWRAWKVDPARWERLRRRVVARRDALWSLWRDRGYRLDARGIHPPEHAPHGSR